VIYRLSDGDAGAGGRRVIEEEEAQGIARIQTYPL
jgi:hypothetical protein